MSNVIDFPIQDYDKLFMAKLQEGLPPEVWTRLQPNIQRLLDRHGSMPDIDRDLQTVGLQRLPPDELEQLRRDWKNSTIIYGAKCRIVVMADLMIAWTENSQLRERIKELEAR